VGSSISQNPICFHGLLWDSFSCFCVAFVMCNMSFIVCVVLCAAFSLSVLCLISCGVHFRVLCLTVVPLPRGKKPYLQFKLNNNKFSQSSLVHTLESGPHVHLSVSFDASGAQWFITTDAESRNLTPFHASVIRLSRWGLHVFFLAPRRRETHQLLSDWHTTYRHNPLLQCNIWTLLKSYRR
jgi:hypothetical protein